MASFYADLQVAGTTYPVRSCAYEFTQSTNERGRVAAKVRHGLVRLTLDVPDGDELLSWAAAPFKPLAGRVIFRSAQGGAALETLSWEDGQCVGYQEEFLSGSVNEGAYVCQLTIAAPKLTMAPGGPASYVSPAAGEHGSPQQAFMDPFLVPLLAPPPVISPLVVPVAEDLAAVAARMALSGLAVVAAPAILTLALILGSATPAGGPGIPQPHGLPLDPNVLRLNTLAARHAAGTLTSNEEAEYISLLAKVKGIHVNKLSDLADPNAIALPLRGGHVPLRNFTYLHNFAYTKRNPADRKKLRYAFDKPNGIRADFLKDLAKDPVKMARLKKLGMSESNLDRIKAGLVPSGYQVHHKLSLDDGGDNSFDNLVIIHNDPYHISVTVLQNTSMRGLAPGETRILDWPTINDYIYPNY